MSYWRNPYIDIFQSLKPSAPKCGCCQVYYAKNRCEYKKGHIDVCKDCKKHNIILGGELHT